MMSWPKSTSLGIKCVAICTDVAAAFIDYIYDLVKQIKAKAPFSVWTHCFLNIEVIASKNLA